MTAIETLLHGLIDYAGLFPPASLDMKTAVSHYAEYRNGENSEMLGRFILPVQRLTEFTAAFYEVCCDETAAPWLLNVLASSDSAEDAERISKFSEGAAYLDAIEYQAANAEDAQQKLKSVPKGMIAYVEFAPEQCEEILPVLKKYDARAKIRTGGVTEGAIPSIERVAQFLECCAQSQIACKATAGLHHPIRSEQKLTYEEGSQSAMMHGFINVFVAATVAYKGAPLKDIVDVLLETKPDVFQWGKDALRWRNIEISTKQIRDVRDNFAISFGSCSFVEPIQYLKALGWL
ncbi:MAG TPA: hypothetical protein VHB45_11865 [Alloacidobacterium sp.]|nr:hypothetical protein [Alloacidobacterium sp.]